MSDVWYNLRKRSSSGIHPTVFYDRGFSSILSKRDSVSSVSDEEIPEVDDSISSKMIIQEKSSFQFEGVRFTPKVIEFNDAFDGKQFQQRIRLQNVGKKPVFVKIAEPSSFVFHMNEHDKGTKLLSSGRSITRTLSYIYHNNDIVLRSQIRVQVNGRCIDYPIIVRRAQPAIEVRPTELDFKVINMGASAKTLKLTLINSGGKGTKFAIDFGRNELDLVVNPARGTIRAKSQMNVFVEMVGLTEGEFYREMWITTSERPIRVPIIAEVMRPRLEVYHPNATGDFTLINFPPTFRGTQRLDTIVLRNFSADVTPFAISAEIGGELKEFSEARKLEPAFQMFTMSAEEGRLEPFESRIVTISFKPVKVPVPQGWYHKRAEESKKHLSNEFLVFFRINRVHCIERHELEKSDAEPKTDNMTLVQKELGKRQSIMLSVTSIMGIPGFGSINFDSRTKLLDSDENSFSNPALPAPLEDKDVVRLCIHGTVWEPDLLVQPDSLLFENSQIGTTETKVLKLMNQAPIKMKFKCLNAVNMIIKPSCSWLQPKEAIDVEVLYTPTFQGKVKNSIKIELFGKSSVLYDYDKDIVRLKVLKVEYNAFVAGSVPTHLPGMCSRKPFTKKSQPGSKSKSIKYDNTHSKSYGTKLRKDKKQESTIPKGDGKAVVALTTCPRYPKEKAVKSVLTEYYRPCDDVVDDPFMIDIIRMKLSERRKLMKMDKLKQEDIHLQIKSLIEKENILQKLVLVPLSPIFLSKVKVEPKLIDFAMVAPNTSITETLKLHNMNAFPVSVRFIPGKSGVTLPDGDIRLVPPLGKKLLKIIFKTKDSGRYNGFLDYVINGSHMFKITVSANVVPKTLIIPDNDLNLFLGNYPASAAFQPNSTSIGLINNLRSPIKFHWEMQSDSAFFIEPLSGEIPPMTLLMNYVYFSLHPEKSIFGEANLVSESGVTQPVKLSYRKFKSSVYFSLNKIELNEIALNLLETVNARLINVNYYDVAFEVMDCSPIPGVKISPSQGIIKARCFYDLKIQIRIPVIIDFQFDLRVRIQNGSPLSLKVQGAVVFPMVKVTPLEVTMRKISVQSFDVASICVENTGTTPFQMEINLKEYPEYSISRSKNKQIQKLEEEKIYLAPNKSCKFYILFEPQDVARYQFYLPIVINGILGPAMLQDGLTENVSFYLEKYEASYEQFGRLTRSSDLKLKVPYACINCTVIGHLLKFSTLNIVFRKHPNQVTGFQTEELEIKNINSSPVSISIRTDDVNNSFSPFKLEVMKDKVEHFEKAFKINLQAEETVTLNATFRPRKAGIYIVEIPVFLKGYNDGYAYNMVTLTGELKKATIYAETKEIHFPPLPPRIGSEVIIQVIAERYTSPEVLTCSVLDMEDGSKSTGEGVKILWLDEPKITGTRFLQSFSVQITFQSQSTVSLRTFLIFSDGAGEIFPLLLTAVSDKCSITSHLFLSTRSTKYKIVREEVNVTEVDEEAYYPAKAHPSRKLTYTTFKSEVKKHKGKGTTKTSDADEMSVMAKIDPGPKLIIQPTKSMQRLTQLNFVCIEKIPEHRKHATTWADKPISVLSRMDILSDSTKSSLKIGKGICETSTEITFPDFPNGEDNSYYEKYLRETLGYVELWVYEVVFHCEEYMVIPTSFQTAGENEWVHGLQNRDQKSDIPKKTVIDLVVALAGPNVLQYFPARPMPSKDPSRRAEYLYSVFNCLLNFLSIQGSFLPHVTPEVLLCYEDYQLILAKRPIIEPLRSNGSYGAKSQFRGFSQNQESCPRRSVGDFPDSGDFSFIFNESLWKSPYEENYEGDLWKYGDSEENAADRILFKGKKVGSSNFGTMREYTFKHNELDEKTFNLRSTQAWLDVILQIYRTLTLPKIIYKKSAFSIPEFESTFSTEVTSSFPQISWDAHKRNRVASTSSFDNTESNIYTYQERILLAWLKYHYDLQRTSLWPTSFTNDIGKSQPPRNIDCFRTDLSDSLVLIAVTASYCPYLIPNYFVDVFPQPENHEQIHHNAIKLTSAWREVNIALSVEPKDIVLSNGIFMLMIVCHLYEVLPLLCPRSYIRFTAPLTGEMTKTIELYNKFNDRVIYEAKFIGLQERSFELIGSSTICLKPKTKHHFKIAYRAKSVQKVSVTLLLDGAYVSPNFAKSIVFQLEGEPSELTEYSKIRLHGSLYKVTCMEIPISSPYPEETTYEISYSTVSPRHSDPKLLEMKPWRDIWNRKTSRRLFINQSQLIYPGQSHALLSITIACLTTASRQFWLLFHSEVGDFIVRIDVITKFRDNSCAPISVILSNLEKPDIECTCTDVTKSLSRKTAPACPMLHQLKVPARNYYLWDTMFTMFQKTLDPKEKMFWKQHFETNIGIRLIKWLLSQDDSPEVTEEFIPSLRTNVTYTLHIDSDAEKYIKVPPTVEITDVRLREPVYLPIHISSSIPNDFRATLTMTSENRKEIRTIRYAFQKPNHENGDPEK